MFNDSDRAKGMRLHSRPVLSKEIPMSQHISDTDITRIQLFPWKGEGYNGVFWDIDSPSESNIPEADGRTSAYLHGVLRRRSHERPTRARTSVA